VRNNPRSWLISTPRLDARRSNMPFNSTPWPKRFWDKVDKNGPTPEHCPELGQCWIWKGAKKHGTSYGLVKFLGKPMRAHRVAWFIIHGEWPSECILHRCDNPPCVRDSHLFDGTQADNMADRYNKGRYKSHRELCIASLSSNRLATGN
jgi:hypothetical protein